MQSAFAGGSLLLVLGTWLLWTPQLVFPRVPLWSQLADLPPQVDTGLTWFLLAAWSGISLALMFVRLPSLAWSYLCLFLALVAFDQHRLQPWGIHIGVSLLLLTSLPRQQAQRYLIWLTASIYIYSALSKFDAQFLYTVGQDFLATLIKPLGLAPERMSQAARLACAAAFPIGELICGAGLAWAATRRAALWLAIVMHLVLLAILGPWGLGHSWGVLLWNGLFIVQNIWLICTGQLAAQRNAVESENSSSIGSDSSTREATSRRGAGWSWAGLVCGVVIVLPLGERWGAVDHWLGWALYAPHSSRATIELTQAAAERMPEWLQEHIGPPDVLGWRRVAVDTWSIRALRVPIYPQQRFYVGVARALGSRVEELEIRVVLQSMATRFSGRRQLTVLEGRSQLEQAARRYWFSTQPVLAQ